MSILPPPQKDGEIKFMLAKSLPYRPRMALIALTLAAGLGLQVTIGFWPGYALLIAGLLLGMNSGYDAAPRLTGVEAWEKVSPDEFGKVLDKAKELSKWDEDFFDGTSPLGLAGLVLTALACSIAYYVVSSRWSFPDGYFFYFGLDALAIIFPLWFVGTRDYLRKDRLVIKVEMLEKVMAALNDPSDAQVQPMLSLNPTEKGGKEPEDARLMVKLVGAPKDFYGLQVQLSINSVQGKDYPYLYCVLIAKHGSGLLKDWQKFADQPEKNFLSGIFGQLLGNAPTGLVYEPSDADEVEIIVVRQRTTRESGYYTNADAALTVVNKSLGLARGLLSVSQAGGPPPPPPPQVEQRQGIS